MRPPAPRPLAAALCCALLALSTAAQVTPTAPPEPPPDQVVLKNGDHLTGTVKSMADGKLTLTSPLVGDVVIKMEDITNLITGKPITVRTRGGETLQRRVTGIEGGALQLANAEAGGPTGVSVPLADLEKINPPDKPQWTGSIAFNFSMSDGNTERRAVGATAEAERRTEVDRLNAKGAWNYSEDKNGADWVLTQRRLSGELQYDYFLTKKLYVLAQTSALGDELANIALRFTAGAGLGYQWYDTEKFGLGTEAGPSYFRESYRDSTPDTDTVAARLAYHLKWEIADGISFLQDVAVFPSTERLSDVYLNADSRARLTLTESMFAQLQWVIDYDNTPSPGRERVDDRYLIGVGWTF